MAHHTSTAVTSDTPTAIRPATLRGGLALAVLAALTAFAVRAQAQQGQLPSALENSSRLVNTRARTNRLGLGAIGVEPARPVVVQFGETSSSTPPGPQDSSK
jgi:hypothetical protein